MKFRINHGPHRTYLRDSLACCERGYSYLRRMVFGLALRAKGGLLRMQVALLDISDGIEADTAGGIFLGISRSTSFSSICSNRI